VGTKGAKRAWNAHGRHRPFGGARGEEGEEGRGEGAGATGIEPGTALDKECSVANTPKASIDTFIEFIHSIFVL
jgi:hypothetical protein